VKALVTGGAGFIGSHLVDRLVASGREVQVIDNLISGEQRLSFLEAAGVCLDRVDIRDQDCSELIDSFAPNEIYHLAAQMDVRRSVADPIYDADVNVLGTLRVLEGARRVGARVISASSGGCIYGEVDPELLPADESTPKNPDSPYGITKFVMEEYLRFYRAAYGLDYVNLALGNVFGPRQDPFGEAGVVAMFTQRLIDGRPCSFYGNGEQTRDFVYVGDVVEAFLAAAGGGSGETFNIGTGRQTTVNRLYVELARICGVDRAAIYEPPRAGELQHSSLNSSKAREVLGWAPKVDLVDGLARTVEFIRSQPGRPA
jgi:UDP-glucose 4-epimerase